MKIKILIAGLVGILWMASAANADPYVIDGFGCNAGNAINGVSTDDVTGNEGGATDCFGTFDKNDPGPSGDGISYNGDVFTYVSKVNINNDGSQSAPDGAIIGLQNYDFTDGKCVAPEGTGGMEGAASSGCWAYDPDLFSADAFLVVIKAANSPGWAAFLFEGADAASWFGSWSIGWQPNGTACGGHVNADGSAGTGSCANTSHIAIYALNGTVVPEPGTLALLGLGLIGMGAIRRRNEK